MSTVDLLTSRGIRSAISAGDHSPTRLSSGICLLLLRSRTEWRDGRDRSGERRGPRSRSRSKGRKSRERRRSKSREKRERSSKSMERSSKTPDPRFSDMERFDKFEGMSEEEKAQIVRAK